MLTYNITESFLWPNYQYMAEGSNWYQYWYGFEYSYQYQYMSEVSNRYQHCQFLMILLIPVHVLQCVGILYQFYTDTYADTCQKILTNTNIGLKTNINTNTTYQYWYQGVKEKVNSFDNNWFPVTRIYLVLPESLSFNNDIFLYCDKI